MFSHHTVWFQRDLFSLFPLFLRKARHPPPRHQLCRRRLRRGHRVRPSMLHDRSPRGQRRSACRTPMRPNLRHVQIERIEHDIIVTILIVCGRRNLDVRPDGVAQRIVEFLAVRVADRCGRCDDDLGQGGYVLVLRRQQHTMVEVTIVRRCGGSTGRSVRLMCCGGGCGCGCCGGLVTAIGRRRCRSACAGRRPRRRCSRLRRRRRRGRLVQIGHANDLMRFATAAARYRFAVLVRMRRIRRRRVMRSASTVAARDR